VNKNLSQREGGGDNLNVVPLYGFKKGINECKVLWVPLNEVNQRRCIEADSRSAFNSSRSRRRSSGLSDSAI
jgi:hypothetical protein